MEAQKVTQGWFETIKDKFQKLANQFDFSGSKLIEYSIALGGGILAGFLVKRYGRQTIMGTLILIAVLLGLSYFHVITIDWTKVREFIGFAPASTIELFFQEYWQWAINHFISVFLCIIGFLIGFKIG